MKIRVCVAIGDLLFVPISHVVSYGGSSLNISLIQLQL